MGRFDLSTVHEPPRREAGSWFGRLRDFYVAEGFSHEEAERHASEITRAAIQERAKYEPSEPA